MVWGLLPFDFKVSFEAHITGVVAGVILAFFYRDEGPEPEGSSLDDEEEEDEGEQGSVIGEQGAVDGE